MNKSIKKPMDLGSILDRTFQLVKQRFVPFFVILLILTGPYYVFSLLTSLSFGTSFFRELIPETGDQVQDFLNRISGSDPTVEFPFFNLNAGIIIFGIISFLCLIALSPMAKAAIIVVIYNIQNNETASVKTSIHRAFSRFWPLFGSSILYGLILTGIIVGFSLILSVGFLTPFPGAIIVILLYIACLLCTLYLAVRWAFYFPAVLFEEVAPGLGKSWQLTKGNFWRLIGIYIVIALITTIISGVITSVVNNFLGTSIIAEVIGDLVAIVADMVTIVGFAVVYFDLRVRNDSEDLLDMIEDYEETEPTNPID